MSLAGHMSDDSLYKGDKGVSDAAHPPEGGPAETRGLSASNLPLIFDTRPARMPDGLANAEIRRQ